MEGKKSQFGGKKEHEKKDEAETKKEKKISGPLCEKDERETREQKN